MRTAIDTNVLSALWSAEPVAAAMADALEQAASEGMLIICPVVYAELLAHPKASPDFIEQFLAATDISVDFAVVEPVWRDVAARFAKYAVRRRVSKGGSPKRVVADFIVGAHALSRADRLLTLDRAPYVRDFPELELMTGE